MCVLFEEMAENIFETNTVFIKLADRYQLTAVFVYSEVFLLIKLMRISGC